MRAGEYWGGGGIGGAKGGDERGLLPNLVIAGAPKSGTSSVFRWLADHPQVLGSSVKETYYFVDPGSHMCDPGRHFLTGGIGGYRGFFPAPRTAGRGGRIFSLIAASFACAVLLVLFCYSFQMSKFLLPVVPFACVLAARGIVLLVSACKGKGVGPALARVPAAILLLLTAWGCAVPFVPDAFLRPGAPWQWCAAPYSQHIYTHPAFPWRWYEGMVTLDRIAPQDAVLISAIDGVFVTHYFVKGTRRAYVPISRDPEYVRQRRLELPAAIEDQAWIAEAARGGRRIYMDGYTYLAWGRYRAAMERNFVFVPAASYGGGALSIFELHPRPSGGSAS